VNCLLFLLLCVIVPFFQLMSLSMVPLQLVQNFKFHCIFLKVIQPIFNNQITNLIPSLEPLFNVHLWVIVEENKRKRKDYEDNITFQNVWNAKLSWVEFMVNVHHIRCNVYIKIWGKEKIMAFKFNNLWKHGGRRNVLFVI
jgi:hypothetical protein